jgi:hypothetical protein
MFRVKICGVTTPDDARMVAAAGADAVGLNFVPGSPRCLTVESARLVAAALPAGILRIGVCAGMDPSAVRGIAESVGLDAIQFHGHLAPPAAGVPNPCWDPPGVCRDVAPIPVIRACRLRSDGPATAALDECVACGVEAYVAATVNGSFCRQCPQHANSSELSVGIDSCLCAAGYFRAGESWDAGPTIEHAEALEAVLLCEACASGVFKATPGNQACARCPAGTTGASETSSSSTLRVDESSCAPCSADTYSTLRYSPDARADVFECVACPDNALSAASSTDVGNCTCRSGFAFAATGSPCEACAPGRFKREAANALCALCEIGAYAFGAASACTPCPANTTTAHAGAENSSACVCRPGYVLASDAPVDRGGSCALCAPGSFSEGLGAAACEDCGAHAFLSLLAAPGVRACEACPARSRAGSRALGCRLSLRSKSRYEVIQNQ